ncbi:MAG: hypothetical protein GXY47_00775, partial [Acidobacteria bacterium]|nr:hypothetical protein [Acidobacteriota bacterium]
MSDSTLCTAGDFAQSEKLHRAFAEAERKRQEAQPRIDQAHADYELAALHRHAAGSLCDGVPQARIEALDAEVARARAE